MYGEIEGVAARVPALGVFGASTTPTEAQVTVWLEEVTVLINGALASAGYAIDVASTTAGYAYLSGMAELYAAASALEARGIDSVSGEGEQRSQDMFERFWKQLKLLSGGNLEALGLTLLVTPPRRRGIRTTQLRRIDGYSATYEGSATEYSYPSE